MIQPNNYNLDTLVRNGSLNKGDKLYFVCDPLYSCVVAKGDSGEYKLKRGTQVFTVEEICEEWLGSDFEDNPYNWIQNDAGKTLHDLWHQSQSKRSA